MLRCHFIQDGHERSPLIREKTSHAGTKEWGLAEKSVNTQKNLRLDGGRGRRQKRICEEELDHEGLVSQSKDSGLTLITKATSGCEVEE